MRIFFIITLLITFSFSKMSPTEAISSENRSIVYLDKRIKFGEYKKAIEFGEKANKRFPNNPNILGHLANAYYNDNKLVLAEQYAILALEEKPNDDLLLGLRNKIAEKLKGVENEVISGLKEYLSDKGLDFLMIFLAFLGGTIVSNRYDECYNTKILYTIKKAINKDELCKSYMKRAIFLLKNSCNIKNIFSFCLFFEIIMTLIVSSSILIIFLFAEINIGSPFFTHKEFVIMTDDVMWRHAFISWIFFTVLTIAFRFFIAIKNFHDDPNDYVADLAQNFQDLHESHSHVKLKSAITILKASNDYEDIKNELSKYFKSSDEDLLKII